MHSGNFAISAAKEMRQIVKKGALRDVNRAAIRTALRTANRRAADKTGFCGPGKPAFAMPPTPVTPLVLRAENSKSAQETDNICRLLRQVATRYA